MTGFRVIGDWGSTRLRLWRVHGDALVDRRDGPGIVGLTPKPAQVLREAIEPWLTAGEIERISLCGMAGARGGLMEAKYVDCPASSRVWRRNCVELELEGITVRIAAGCATSGRGAVTDDVMRGEETQIYGAIMREPALREGRQVAVLPGTHSKWAIVENGQISTFRTFPTGELYALLQRSSLIATQGDNENDSEGFEAGLTRASGSFGPLGSLFEARAAQLRSGRSRSWASSFISGILIGGEVTEMRLREPLAAKVWIIGDPALSDRYARALALAGVDGEILDGDACVVSGLRWLDADD